MERVLRIAELTEAWIGFSFRFSSVTFAGLIVVLVILCASGWLVYGRGPRRRRSYKRVLGLLQTQSWSEALEELRRMQSLGLLSQTWQARARQAEGECHRLAGETALREKCFEQGLESLLKSARLLDRDDAECRARVVEEILAEIRRHFAADSSLFPRSRSNQGNSEKSPGPREGPMPKLIRSVSQLQSPCAEASFWQALWQVQEGHVDAALASLEESRSASAQPIFDPSFYLGVLLSREGRIAEALRHLADAIRMAPECPLVHWQMGMAMVAEGGKDNLAIRPLQKALGPNGLTAWIQSPRKLWQETLPDPEHCYVRRLAKDSLFVCPVLGADVGIMVRQGQAALAQTQYRLGNHAEAADLYEAVLRESPPTLTILRGLGLSLARLERYDEAFKHLRAAFDMEQSRNANGAGAWTAGYLALCGAKGRPNQPGDKSKNVSWAIRTLAAFDIRGDGEWAKLQSAVFAEARSLNLPVSMADQVRLCDVLASVDSINAPAAAAYYQLWANFPDALCPVHACLYCRAVQEHRIENPNDLQIFRAAFADESAIRTFFNERRWDLEETEYVFMSRCAAAEKNDPGSPSLLPDYLRQKVETFLLARSERLEQKGLQAEAITSLEVLLRLVPKCGPAYDRLAQLCYRGGNLDAASEMLATWHDRCPNEFLPLVRKAVVDQQRGRPDDCLQTIQKALQLTSGRLRGSIAVLGGRLALLAGQFQPALELFQECLSEDPKEPTALWCSAAVRYLLGDRAGLAPLAVDMDLSDVVDPRFHYLAAVAYLEVGQYDQTIESVRRAVTYPLWSPTSAEAEECAYLVARVQLLRNDIPAATVDLRSIADSSAKPPSADHARAHLARIRFLRGSLEEAIRLWRELKETHRKKWQLDEVLQRTTYLAGVQLLRADQYDEAAGFFRELSQANGKDTRYSSLLTYSLIEAGRTFLSRSDYQSAARFLNEAIDHGCVDREVALDLARVYKHQGLVSEARRVLRNVAEPDAETLFQLGFISLEEKRFAQAENEFAQAWLKNPNSYPIAYNLVFSRLSLGEVEPALDLLPNLIQLANETEDRTFFSLLDITLRAGSSQNGQAPVNAMLADITPEEEQLLLQLTQNLGHPPTAARILSALSTHQRDNASLRAATLETVLLQAKQLLDRCDWSEASRLLSPWVEAKEHASRPMRAALLNLLGCCACLSQDFEAGIHYFTDAVQIVSRDARLSQNLALAYEMQGRISEAEPHWNWYLEILDGRIPTPPDSTSYKDRLAFECLHRLGARFFEKGKSKSALTFLQRAHQLRPEDTDTLERLFHVLIQLKRPEDARRALSRLQQLRPKEPQLEMFELELIEINNLDNCNRVLAGMEALQRKYPDDGRIAERQAQFIGVIVAYMTRLKRQMTEQLERAAARIHHLPSYQMDWPEMKHYLRDMRSRMQRIKKTATRCLPLTGNDPQRRTLQELIRQADHEIDRCRTLVSRDSQRRA